MADDHNLPPSRFTQEQREAMYEEALLDGFRDFDFCPHIKLDRQSLMEIARPSQVRRWCHIECWKCKHRCRAKGRSDTDTTFLCFCQATTAGIQVVSQISLGRWADAENGHIATKMLERLQENPFIVCEHFTDVAESMDAAVEPWAPARFACDGCSHNAFSCRKRQCRRQWRCPAKDCGAHYFFLGHRENLLQDYLEKKAPVAGTDLFFVSIQPLGVLGDLHYFQSKEWNARSNLDTRPREKRYATKIAEGGFVTVVSKIACRDPKNVPGLVPNEDGLVRVGNRIGPNGTCIKPSDASKHHPVREFLEDVYRIPRLFDALTVAEPLLPSSPEQDLSFMNYDHEPMVGQADSLMLKEVDAVPDERDSVFDWATV